MEYRREIDGLRAVAVAAVVCFHAGIGIPGGYAGVDVFFVLSGYLITRFIYEDPKFTLKEFYERRLRRILPALFLSISATLTVGFFLMLPEDFKSLARNAFATLLFASNFYSRSQAGDYFGPAAETQPLLHTWSLGVEEQFYLVFPLGVLALRHLRLGRQGMLAALTLCLLVSLAFSQWAVSHKPAVAFFLLPSRAWELLFGAVLAVAGSRSMSRPVEELTGLAGLVAIAAAVVLLNSHTPFPGLAAVPACLGTALVVAGRSGYARTILATAPLVALGRISYSLYLWHWPIIVLATYYVITPLSLLERLTCVAVAIILAVLSTRYVEAPFRNRSRVPLRGLRWALSLQAAVLLLGAAMVVQFEGLPGRFPDYVARPVRSHIDEYRPGECFFLAPGQWGAQNCRLSHLHSETVILWGDSHAAQLIPGFASKAALLPFDVTAFTVAGCLPLIHFYNDERCRSEVARGYQAVIALAPTIVILSGAWSMRDDVSPALRRTVDTLTAHGIKAIVIGQTPEFSYTTPEALLYRLGGQSESDISGVMKIKTDYNSELRYNLGDVYFIDPMHLLCRPSDCPLRRDGEMLYIDASHLSALGSRILVERMAAAFNRFTVDNKNASSDAGLR